MTHNQTLSLTEIHPDEEHPPLSTVSNVSVNSDMSSSSKNSVTSSVTNTTASVSSNKSVDQIDFSEYDSPGKNNLVEQMGPLEVISAVPKTPVVIPTSLGISSLAVPILSVPTMTLPASSGNVEVSVLIPASPTMETLPNLPTNDTSGESIPTSTINVSSSHTITNSGINTTQSNGGPSETVKIRKVSPISQSSGRDSPKREVYV